MTPPQDRADRREAHDSQVDKKPYVDADEFRLAMRQITLPVAVITSRHCDARTGMTATSISSVSAVPPTMLVCVNRNAGADKIIADSGAFAINMLADAHHPVARLFSAPVVDAAETYGVSDWREMVTGAPVLEGAVAVFDCCVESCFVSGSHAIYVGRVVGVASLPQDVLLYRDGLFRRLQPIT